MYISISIISRTIKLSDRKKSASAISSLANSAEKAVQILSGHYVTCKKNKTKKKTRHQDVCTTHSQQFLTGLSVNFRMSPG